MSDPIFLHELADGQSNGHPDVPAAKPATGTPEAAAAHGDDAATEPRGGAPDPADNLFQVHGPAPAAERATGLSTKALRVVRSGAATVADGVRRRRPTGRVGLGGAFRRRASRSSRAFAAAAVLTAFAAVAALVLFSRGADKRDPGVASVETAGKPQYRPERVAPGRSEHVEPYIRARARESREEPPHSRKRPRARPYRRQASRRTHPPARHVTSRRPTPTPVAPATPVVRPVPVNEAPSPAPAPGPSAPAAVEPDEFGIER